MAAKPKPHVFLSYVREDAERVELLAADLEARGVGTWIDRYQIKPGQRWEQAIEDAIRSGAFFIACFSQAYVARTRTHMNEELLLAIEEVRLRPAEASWFIPIRLDDCEIPDLPIATKLNIRSFQWLDMFPDWSKGLERLVNVIKPSTTLGTPSRGPREIPTAKAPRLSARARRSLRARAQEHPLIASIVAVGALLATIATIIAGVESTINIYNYLLDTTQPSQLPSQVSASTETLAKPISNADDLSRALAAIALLRTISSQSPTASFYQQAIDVLVRYVRENIQYRMGDGPGIEEGRGTYAGSYRATDIVEALKAMQQILQDSEGNAHVDLTNTNFDDVNLSGLNLSGFWLNYSSFRRSYLSGCVCKRVFMNFAKLIETVVWNADFEGASFEKANLQGSKWACVNLAQTNVEEASNLNAELIDTPKGLTDKQRQLVQQHAIYFREQDVACPWQSNP